MDAGLVADQEIPVLIIGYGSIDQGDAYGGYSAAQRMQELHLPGVQTVSVDMLTPKLAPLIVKAQTVIFIGSYHVHEKMNPEIIFKHFLPNQLQISLDLAYDNPPQGLLTFTKAIYHKIPDAYWMLLPAITYRATNRLSCATETAIKEALKYFSLPSNLNRFLRHSPPKELAINC